ncbi:MAG TPA: hypothetical protein VFA04_24165 [Bryobacteraceae bacterium]|nr:hypothetical protein [Bryobacteraceae bacterium]
MSRPISRHTPVLLFLVLFASGSAWMIRPEPGGPAPLPPMPQPAPVYLPLTPSPPVADETPRITDADVQQLRTQLETAEAAVREAKDSLQISQAELDALQKKVDALRAELAALEAKRAAILAAMGPIAPSPDDDLARKVNLQREEAAKLESNLQALRDQLAALDVKTRLRTALRPAWKLPRPVELCFNRIAPLDKDFFHYPLLAMGVTETITRKRPGETIAEARRPDSAFSEFLARVREQGGYVSCLVNSDSFQAFFAVREMAARYHLDVSWEPAWTQNGAIAVTRVHLIKKASKKDITVDLPQIVR